MSDETIRNTEAEFANGLRQAVSAITWVVLASVPVGAGVLRPSSVYDPVWPQIVSYTVLLAIAATEAVLLIRKRRWRRLRLPAVVLALGASVASCASLPAGSSITSDDWAFGTVGWAGVILMLDRPIGELIGFLGAHEAITAVNLVLSGTPGEAELLNFIAGSIGAIGYPLATGLAATVLRDVARKAEHARRSAEEERTAAKAEAERAAAGQRRYSDLSVTAVPLLRGFAHGTLDPEDPEVQKRCWIEAARMRRLFAEADEAPDPLLHELGQCVRAATRRGIRAELRTHGDVPPVSVEIRRALVDLPLAALAAAVSRARVTVIGTPDLVTVSVRCDGVLTGPPALAGEQIQAYVDVSGGDLWVETRWIVN